MNITILRFDSIDSTNTKALKHARQEADEGLCIVARQQTEGRGRHGRVWESPPDAGLYFSVVLRPKMDVKYLPLITLMAGVAVYEVLAEFGLTPDIKWVNDVLVGEKKICGILAETTETSKGLAVVVGIGINLRSSSVLPDLADTATSVAKETSSDVSFTEVEELLVRHIGYWYEIFNGEDGPKEIIEAWRRRSSYFSGKLVRVQLENDTAEGFTDGLEQNGALRLKTVAGDLLIVQAGEIQRLRHVKPPN